MTLSLRNEFHRIVHNFLESSNFQESFSHLDELCEFITASPSIVLEESSSVPVSDLVAKTAEIDAWTEKNYASEWLTHIDEGTEYPWLLTDYYTSEYDFITSHMDTPPQKIAYFGHGSISALTSILLDNLPDVHIDMFDIDAETSRTCQKILGSLHPDAKIDFHIGDIEDQELTSGYDLMIVTNAPVPFFENRIHAGEHPIPVKNIFIRSSTPQAAIIYPRMDTNELGMLADRNLNVMADPVYNIHEMLMLTQ